MGPGEVAQHLLPTSYSVTYQFLNWIAASEPLLAMAPALKKYDWLMAIISIFFCVSSFGNGANDVANR